MDALDWQQRDQVLSVNLTGAVLTPVSTLPHVVDGGSLVVNGSSMAIRPRDQRLADVAAKEHGAHAPYRAGGVSAGGPERSIWAARPCRCRSSGDGVPDR
jgi:hypothetical protein